MMRNSINIFRTVSVKNLNQKYTHIVLVVCFSLLACKGQMIISPTGQKATAAPLNLHLICHTINDVTAGVYLLTADGNLL